ncbi:peptidase [Mesobacillus campisalis]|uniref:Peptidase n=1 Tax=Mesobacillus campisalis TaxID=1408103 RepID=A0A0M2T303_9BACI|nr:sigma-E processing peptidase SpoIIGA [Mesobacillus campisalis]KKK39647.1 peptidase [Mesobacillus campisalis]
MTVYLDVIWGLNLLFDALLLYLTAIMLKRSVKLWRIFAGGLIGSLLILLAVTPFSYAGHPVVKLGFSIMMVLAVFGFKRLSFFLKGLMAFYLVTFLIGGALMGVHFFISYDLDLTSSVAIANVKGFGDPVSWLFVLIGFPLAWHFSKQGIGHMEMAKIQFDQLAGVRLCCCGMELQLKGLVDSGNQLYDPISRMPVMFVSVASILNEVPETVKDMAENPEGIIMGEGEFPTEFEHKMKIIPCRVVGQEHQLIIAMKPDILEIESDGKIYSVDKALVSFTTQQLSADGAFQCIIHPKMLTGTASQAADVKVS